jgi:hypothetical protein
MGMQFVGFENINTSERMIPLYPKRYIISSIIKLRKPYHLVEIGFDVLIVKFGMVQELPVPNGLKSGGACSSREQETNKERALNKGHAE